MNTDYDGMRYELRRMEHKAVRVLHECQRQAGLTHLTDYMRFQLRERSYDVLRFASECKAFKDELARRAGE